MTSSISRLLEPSTPSLPDTVDRSSSTASAPRAPRPAVPLLAAAGWAVATVVYASHLYLFHTLRGFGTSFWFQLAEASLHFGVWALLAPWVRRLAAARPLSGPQWPGRLGFHLAIGLALALLQVVIHAALDHSLLHASAGGLPGLAERVTRLFTRTYYANVLVYLGLVVAFVALEAARRKRAADLETGRSPEARAHRPGARRPAEGVRTEGLGFQDFVTVEREGRIRVLPVREIDCFVSEGNYVEVFVRDASYRLRGSLKEIEAKVDPRRFFRTHRSAIVNLASVAEIRPLFGDRNEVVLRTGRRVPLSRRHRYRLPELL